MRAMDRPASRPGRADDSRHGCNRHDRSLVVQELVAAGAQVRALVRKVDRASLPDDVETATGDLADPGSLAPALPGVERLYLLAPFEPWLVEWERNVLDAARRAGVRHVVTHSGLGASPEAPFVIGRWHGEAQRQLEGSGLAFTHLQPHSFMQNSWGRPRRSR
jgi:uncharacterized protein YbjT (DUF2867 family)